MTTSFTLEIDAIHARDGWMDCWLGVDGQRRHLDASSVFPPFQDALGFARALAADTLPHEFFWDEEGHGALFRASPLAPESPNFRLYIDHDGEVVVDAELERAQVASVFLDALRGVALDCPGAESEWVFPYFLVENLERDWGRGFAAPERPLCMARFVFSHYGGYGGQDYPGFTLWVDDRALLYLALDDIPRLWQMWFTWLEGLVRRDLPGEAPSGKEEDAYGDHSLTFEMGAVYRFSAQPAPEAHNFRLRVVRSIPAREEENVLLDALLERRQFVGAFVETLAEFLATDYSAFLNSAERRFDLRSLPLERLRGELAE